MSGQSLDETTQEHEGNDLDSSSKRRKTEMSIDRLSALPDGILIHILSFLDVEESAVTSILSKRWRFIWTELPRLEFREYSWESEKIRQFVAKLHRTLLMRSSMARLEKFVVNFYYNDSFASDVDSWVDFALQNKVKKFSLLLSAQQNEEEEDEDEEEKLYALRETMYSNSSLTRFSVKGCDLDTLTKIEWPSLTCLYIAYSELPQHVVDNVLSGCPLLRTLDLIGCWGFNCLDVKSQNLCKLRVVDREDSCNEDLLEISVPYVHTLLVSFHRERRNLVLRSTKSLVRAELNYIESWSTSYEVLKSTTKELFEALKDVKELELGQNYLKVLSEMVVSGLQLPVSRRKSLTVNTFIDDEHNISCIFALLKFSPNLERFVIECLDLENVEGTWDEAAVGLDCDLLHLKSVKISKFADPDLGGEPMLTVARTLLKRATALKEMTVRLGLREISDYTKIGLTLLNYPRSSEKAVIRLH